jgi:hypothetical protein
MRILCSHVFCMQQEQSIITLFFQFKKCCVSTAVVLLYYLLTGPLCYYYVLHELGLKLLFSTMIVNRSHTQYELYAIVASVNYSWSFMYSFLWMIECFTLEISQQELDHFELRHIFLNDSFVFREMI